MKMIITNFPLCYDCINKEKIEGLKDDEFYCSFVSDFLPKGIVAIDTDATKCVEKGWYKSIKEELEKKLKNTAFSNDCG